MSSELCDNVLTCYYILLHSFNGLFSGKTGVRRYQKGKTSLDLNETRDFGVWGAVASAGQYANNLLLCVCMCVLREIVNRACALCCTQVIRSDDYKSTYGEAVRFSGDVEVSDADFVRVRCYSTSSDTDRPVYTDFHALVRLKPDVERRCNEALKQRRSTDDLLDVLMIGVDSTSRLNAIRRLNSTRQFLIQQLHVSSILLYIHTHTHLTALFRDYPGEPVPER